MGILLILLAVVLFLSWTNGANDNFKGTATLWGSGTAGFRTAPRLGDRRHAAR